MSISRRLLGLLAGTGPVVVDTPDGDSVDISVHDASGRTDVIGAARGTGTAIG